ncbi:hypothetical protein R3P38DRAFT_2813728 [Favolaschia claudopus]|uniref:Uncharacterized protein n=1 Tax=Favolaschia claudopus TaxID=2862362 RepID=A0AAV9Z4T1_9AGAR
MHKQNHGCEHVRNSAVLKHEKFTAEQHTEKDTELDDSYHTEHSSRRLRNTIAEWHARKRRHRAAYRRNGHYDTAERRRIMLHPETPACRSQRPTTGHANRISTAAQRHTGEIGAAAQRHASEIGTTTQRLESSQFEPEDKTTAKEN